MGFLDGTWVSQHPLGKVRAGVVRGVGVGEGRGSQGRGRGRCIWKTRLITGMRWGTLCLRVGRLLAGVAVSGRNRRLSLGLPRHRVEPGQVRPGRSGGHLR